MDTLLIPAQYNGPASSANGGWTSGAVAELSGLPEPVTVQLRRPPPLEQPLDVVPTDAGVELRDGDELVALAQHDAALTWSPPRAVDLVTARAAEGSFPGHRSHPFPRCFSCGPDRDDGLRIFPGRVDEARDGEERVDADRVAATWTPLDAVDTAVTWAALDCVSAWSSDLEHRPLVLARMTAQIESPPQVGTPYVLVGTTVRIEGRKTWTASALYDDAGLLLAQAQHLWIAIDPSVVKQLQQGG